MRENLVLMLEMEGFTVLWAEQGRRGLELARSHLPDLILCDVMMPELDGHGVLQALRADPATATIPFIFLTAKGEKVDQRAGMNLGAGVEIPRRVPAPIGPTVLERIGVNRQVGIRLRAEPKHRAGEQDACEQTTIPDQTGHDGF